MSAFCELLEQLDLNDDEFRVLAPRDDSDWMRLVAAEYLNLRAGILLTLRELSLDVDLATDELRNRIIFATLPTWEDGNFGVIRSDFGELLCYMLLEQLYETIFTYKSIRDRELVNHSGRGIDAIGIEKGNILTLVIGEAKVSDENASPPQVVDRSKDALSKQLVKRIRDDRNASFQAIVNAAKYTDDEQTQELFLKAATLFLYEQWDQLCIKACSVLVRPNARYTVADFGSFRTHVDKFRPSLVRFLIVCFPEEDIDTLIYRWYTEYVIPSELYK